MKHNSRLNGIIRSHTRNRRHGQRNDKGHFESLMKRWIQKILFVSESIRQADELAKRESRRRHNSDGSVVIKGTQRVHDKTERKFKDGYLGNSHQRRVQRRAAFRTKIWPVLT